MLEVSFDIKLDECVCARVFMHSYVVRNRFLNYTDSFPEPISMHGFWASVLCTVYRTRAVPRTTLSPAWGRLPPLDWSEKACAAPISLPRGRWIRNFKWGMTEASHVTQLFMVSSLCSASMANPLPQTSLHLFWVMGRILKWSGHLPHLRHFPWVWLVLFLFHRIISLRTVYLSLHLDPSGLIFFITTYTLASVQAVLSSSFITSTFSSFTFPQVFDFGSFQMFSSCT